MGVSSSITLVPLPPTHRHAAAARLNALVRARMGRASLSPIIDGVGIRAVVPRVVRPVHGHALKNSPESEIQHRGVGSPPGRVDPGDQAFHATFRCQSLAAFEKKAESLCSISPGTHGGEFHVGAIAAGLCASAEMDDGEGTGRAMRRKEDHVAETLIVCAQYLFG